MTSEPPGQVELRQSRGNVLQLPILIAVVLLAVVIRQLFPPGPSAVVLGVCGAAAVLDAVFARYVLRNIDGTLLVTSERITFTRGTGDKAVVAQVIDRTSNSTLTFRTARNGPFGSEYTGYVLKLRDAATGKEVYAGAFGRQRVRQACESQGWSFD